MAAFLLNELEGFELGRGRETCGFPWRNMQTEGFASAGFSRAVKFSPSPPNKKQAQKHLFFIL
jgi:hypothetical protein